MYLHLRNRQEHGEKCTAKACADGCGFRGLEEWLASPLTERDAHADARLQARREALWRGEIPA